MEYSFQRLTRIFTIQVQSLYENISYIYLFKYTQYDIKKLLYKNMRCWEEDSDSRDDCKGGEYYQTEPAVTKCTGCPKKYVPMFGRPNFFSPQLSKMKKFQCPSKRELSIITLLMIQVSYGLSNMETYFWDTLYFLWLMRGGEMRF